MRQQFLKAGLRRQQVHLVAIVGLSFVRANLDYEEAKSNMLSAPFNQGQLLTFRVGDPPKTRANRTR